MKRTSFKRKPHWKPLSPISKDPRRRELRFIPIDVLIAIKERSGGRCEVFKMHDYRCMHVAKHPHHILPRSRGGKHAVENLLHVCAECHRWIHDNPSKAIMRGLLR